MVYNRFILYDILNCNLFFILFQFNTLVKTASNFLSVLLHVSIVNVYCCIIVGEGNSTSATYSNVIVSFNNMFQVSKYVTKT